MLEMVGRSESTNNKMSDSEFIKNLWEEIIVKEKLNAIMRLVEKQDNQENLRQRIREELTSLWNNSEIPTLKMILDKLIKLEEGKQKIIPEKEITNKPELKAINAWRRVNEPMMIDISKMKPNISEPIGKVLDNLGQLSKKGKF